MLPGAKLRCVTAPVDLLAAYPEWGACGREAMRTRAATAGRGHSPVSPRPLLVALRHGLTAERLLIPELESAAHRRMGAGLAPERRSPRVVVEVFPRRLPPVFSGVGPLRVRACPGRPCRSGPKQPGLIGVLGFRVVLGTGPPHARPDRASALRVRAHPVPRPAGRGYPSRTVPSPMRRGPSTHTLPRTVTSRPKLTSPSTSRRSQAASEGGPPLKRSSNSDTSLK
jgi:hypothetical protein